MPIPEKKDYIVRTTTRERIYKTLQHWIIAGTLLPEERLNDLELAQHFSVSRTPVREALQMLAEQKLVITVPSNGTFVAPIDQNDLVYVYELLAELQGFAIELSLDRISVEDLEQMRRINQTFYHYKDSAETEKIIHEDWEFHDYIAKMSKNPYVITYTEQLMMQAHRNEIHFFKTNTYTQQSYDTHEQIVQALQNHDLESAKMLMRNNWQISLQ